MYKVIKEHSILVIDGVGHFNIYNISHISALEEFCDGPNMELYFTIDNVKISKTIFDNENEMEFRNMYNDILSSFYDINKIEKYL